MSEWRKPCSQNRREAVAGVFTARNAIIRLCANQEESPLGAMYFDYAGEVFLFYIVAFLKTY